MPMEPSRAPHGRVQSNKPRGPHEDRRARYQDDCNELGNELDPQSIVWEHYMEEAKEQDNELATERNKNLDTLLIFATLYSAILTAFLIQSSDLLVPDNSEVMVALLLMIAQSQQRIELRRPDQLASPVTRPSIPPSNIDEVRAINILWFTSLVISLGVVMMTMLAKEWLGAFISYETRHPHTYTLQRQARFDSLKSWRALPIIDFLPNLLYFSLVLFVIGLIIRLWLLDRIVGIIITVITAPGAVLCAVFVAVGAAVDNCPYRTRFSDSLRKIFSWFNRNKPNLGKRTAAQANGESYIGTGDLYSLQWFLDRGRDPNTINLACQALAGLKSLELNPDDFNLKLGDVGPDPGNEALSQQTIESYCTILTLGARVLDRLKIASTVYYNEVVDCRGANSARYAIALSEIYPHALAWIQQSHRARQRKGKGNLIGRMNVMASDIRGYVFHALDSVWAEQTLSLPFATNTCLYLTIAELKLIGHALKDLKHRANLPGESGGGLNRDYIAITVFEAPGIVKYNSGPTLLADLQKRYNRALGRAALLIQDSFNVYQEIPITSSTRMIRETLLTISDLISEDQLETDQDLYTYDAAIEIHVATSGEYEIPRTICNGQGMRTGLLANVMTLWGPGIRGQQYSIANEVEIVASNLLSQIAPKLMKRWSVRFGQPAWPTFARDPNPTQGISSDAPEGSLTKSVIGQLLDVANFSMFFLNRPNMYQLAEIALESLTCKAGTQDGQRILHEILIKNIQLLVDWIHALRLYNSTPGYPGVEDISSDWLSLHFAKILATRGPSPEGKTIYKSFLEHLLQANCGSEEVISIMKMIGVPVSPLTLPDTARAETLLQDIFDHVTTVTDADAVLLDVFTKLEGFDSLVKIGTVAHTLAARVTFDIVVHLARFEKWVEANAIYNFLVAIHVACNFVPANWGHVSNSFIPATIRHLQELKPSLEHFASPDTVHTIENALSRLTAETECMTAQEARDKARADLAKLAASVQSRIRTSGPGRSLAFPIAHTTPDAWAQVTLGAQQPPGEHGMGRNDDARSLEEFRLQPIGGFMRIPEPRI